MSWQSIKQGRAGQARNHEQDHDYRLRLVARRSPEREADAATRERWSTSLLVVNFFGPDVHQQLHDPEWDVEEQSLSASVAKAAENEGSKDTDVMDMSGRTGHGEFEPPVSTDEMPPLGIEMSKRRANQDQVLRSRRASSTWPHLYSFVPVPGAAIRFGNSLK